MILLTLAFAALPLLSPAGAAAAETGVGDQEILIGSCATLKQDLGTAEKLGAETYLDYVNSELGGVHGRKIRAVFSDDDFTAEGAADCYDRMKKRGVFALAFVATGAEMVRYIKLATADRIPILAPANGAPFMYEPFKRYLLATRSTYTQEAFQLTEALRRELGLKRFAAIYMSDGLGFAGFDGVKQSLQSHGLALAAENSFLRTAEDMGPTVDSVMASKPDGVIIIGNYRQAAKILKYARRKSWRPVFALVTAREAVITEAGDAAEGLIMALLYPHPSRTDLPTVALFRELMAKRHPQTRPDVKILEGFANAVLLVRGLERAGPDLTREKIIDAFERMKNEDIGLGRDYLVSFSSMSHQGFSHADFSVVRGGQSSPITDWKALRATPAKE
jgi:ABC-type branched-subunit amino acid transport system substrate-binding protein